MKILIFTLGSRGDMQPYLALAVGVQHAGHRVTLATSREFSKKLTAEKLAQAIDTAVQDTALRARAAALGERIRAENGVAHAAEVIERHAQAFGQRLPRPA